MLGADKNLVSVASRVLQRNVARSSRRTRNVSVIEPKSTGENATLAAVEGERGRVVGAYLKRVCTRNRDFKESPRRVIDGGRIRARNQIQLGIAAAVPILNREARVSCRLRLGDGDRTRERRVLAAVEGEGGRLIGPQDQRVRRVAL